jgi:hypothetical protein
MVMPKPRALPLLILHHALADVKLTPPELPTKLPMSLGNVSSNTRKDLGFRRMVLNYYSIPSSLHMRLLWVGLMQS